MNQYCRYCSWCTYGDAVYCDKKKATMSEASAKRVNSCKNFAFNEIDVFTGNIYKPKEEKVVKEQKTLFDLLDDTQC